MPTTPPNQAAAAHRSHSSGGNGNRQSWRWGPWLPLGPAVAGIALSLGFHVTLRLWEQTKTYEPLDLSPPFAAKPLPGTSLDSLMRRHGSQLPLLLNPTTTQPDPLVLPPPTLPTTTAGDTPQRPRTNRVTSAAPAIPSTTPVEPSAVESTLPPPPPAFEVPAIPPPPPPNS